MSAFLANINSLSIGAMIDLFTIDFSPIGIDTQINWHPADPSAGNVQFNDITYLSRPISCTGFSKSSQDVPPEPTLMVSNVDKGGNALLKDYGDLLGAMLTRTRTYVKYLDLLTDGSGAVNPTADPSATYIPEIWYIEQKTGNTPLAIQWRLRAATDLYSKKIPARLVLKNVCTRRYRSWNAATGAFAYALKCACPYAGAAMFDAYDVATNDPTKDACTKTLQGCLERFGNTDLPGWFFPGVTRLPQ